MILFSDAWWGWFLHTYAISISLLSSLIIAILKIYAIAHPDVTTNKITDLLVTFFGGSNARPLDKK